MKQGEKRECHGGKEGASAFDVRGQEYGEDFPGGAVVKNPPANAGDMGLSSGLGRSYMPWSN